MVREGCSIRDLELRSERSEETQAKKGPGWGRERCRRCWIFKITSYFRIVYSFTRAAVGKDHGLGRLNSGNVFSDTFGSWKSKRQAPAGPGFPEAPLLGLQVASRSVARSIWWSPCACVSLAFAPLLMRTSVIVDPSLISRSRGIRKRIWALGRAHCCRGVISGSSQLTEPRNTCTRACVYSRPSVHISICTQMYLYRATRECILLSPILSHLHVDHSSLPNLLIEPRAYVQRL